MNDFSALDLLKRAYRLVFPDLEVPGDIINLCNDLSQKAFGKAPRTWRGSLSGRVWVTGFVCDSTAPRVGGASQAHSLIEFTLRYAVPKLIEPDHSQPGLSLVQHARGTLAFNQDGDIWWEDEGGGLNACVNGIAKPRKAVAGQLVGVSFRPAMKKRDVAVQPLVVARETPAEPMASGGTMTIAPEAVEVLKVDYDVGYDAWGEHEKRLAENVERALRGANGELRRRMIKSERGERILRDQNAELRRRIEDMATLSRVAQDRLSVLAKELAEKDEEIAALLAENNRLSVKLHNLERGEADEHGAPAPEPEVWFITSRDLRRANKEPQGLGAGVGETKLGWPGMEE